MRDPKSEATRRLLEYFDGVPHRMRDSRILARLQPKKDSAKPAAPAVDEPTAEELEALAAAVGQGA